MYIHGFVARMFRIPAFLIVSFLICNPLLASTKGIDRQIEPGEVQTIDLVLSADEFLSEKLVSI
jgi:hypothetical protein